MAYIGGGNKKRKGDYIMKTEMGKRLEKNILGAAAKVIRVGMDEEKSFPIPPCTAFLHQPKRPK